MGYVGAGTVEFLYHPEEKTFAFLEVNTRLQVEHSITEVTTDIDLVKAQILVAQGGHLTGEKPAEVGHAVEARLNAEDPDRDFAPSPGRIVHLDLPSGPGIRVDTGVAEGDTIPPDFDSMIAKIIAYGRTREEALARLRRAMASTTVVIEGGACNKSFVLDLLAQPEVVDGTGGWADTGWIDRVRAEGRLVAHAHAGIAVVAAAIEAYLERLQIETARLLETAHGGRPSASHQVGAPVELKLRGVPYQVSTVNTGPGRFRVSVASGATSQTVDVQMEWIDAVRRRLVVGGRRYHLVTATHGPTTLVEVDGVAHRVSRDEGGVLRSPAPALVVATPVSVGAEVEAGAAVVVLESMKMETVVHAPFAARVKELLVITGSQVETGSALIKLEPVGDGAEEATAAGRSRPRAAGRRRGHGPDDARNTSQGRPDGGGAGLLRLPPEDEDAALSEYLAVRDEVRAEGSLLLADELYLSDDLRRPRGAEPQPTGRRGPAHRVRVHSSREHFHTFLQSLDVERGGLPEQFRDRLVRVLVHYGVEDLERTPEPEAAVFRIFLAQQRSTPEVALDVRCASAAGATRPRPTGPLDGPRPRACWSALGRVTQSRYPVIGDLSRSVRFRWFDQPAVDAEFGAWSTRSIVCARDARQGARRLVPGRDAAQRRAALERRAADAARRAAGARRRAASRASGSTSATAAAAGRSPCGSRAGRRRDAGRKTPIEIDGLGIERLQ